MARKQTKEEFITTAKTIFDEEYDYSDVVYINNHTKVSIGCNIHGNFDVYPKNHIHKRRGCPVCGPTNHKKMMQEKQALTTEEFCRRSSIVHDHKYEYSKVVYTNGKNKIIITCPEHGDFLQKPENHLNNKAGCLKCFKAYRQGKGCGGYKESYFRLYPDKKNDAAIFYVTKVTHNKDIFIKIGITIKDGVKGRFYYKSKNGTKFHPMLELPTTLYDAHLKEEYFINNLQEYRFFPNRRFSGYTECFKYNQEVVDIINDHLNTEIELI